MANSDEFHESYTEQESSFIREIRYKKEGQFLQITIEADGSKTVYMYENIPYTVFQNLIKAESMGSYYNTHIKGEYKSVSV